MQNIPILLSGTITELKTLKGRANFVMGAGMQAGTGAAAAGAAVVGSFFSSSLLAQSALSLNEQAVFFTCVVNGIKLSGCFNTLPIQEGETVELVIEPDRTRREGVVYAIRKPELRQLWVAPTMEKGHGSMARMCLGLPLIFLKYFLPFSVVFAVIVSLVGDFFYFIVENWWFIPFITLGGGALVYALMAFGTYITLVPKAQDATLVIAALGYKDAANVSLPLNSELAKLQWAENHGKPFPEDKEDDFVLYY